MIIDHDAGAGWPVKWTHARGRN